MREIVECFDVRSPVREVALKKGVQVTYTTVLESGALYYMAHVRTLPVMYMTADRDLAAARIEHNILPMLQHSGFADIIRSADEGNERKTGKTANHLQFEGGGYLVPFGARNADKMRSFSICVLLRDEIDAWPDTVGKDGDPVTLSADRCAGYWERRKIFSGSTPLIKGASKIEAAFLRGDQRRYMVLCRACGFAQTLRWSTKHPDTGLIGGFRWELDEGTLVPESVRYCCAECGAEHFEHDKERLFSPEHGAHWRPTARPAEPEIRSYHLPAMYSPIGMAPWHKLAAMYLGAFDPEAGRVRDIGRFQVFYNNVLAEPFEVIGARVRFVQVSAHRRSAYRYGQIPNVYAVANSGGPILVLTCTVDVHKRNLAVAVMGWTVGTRCYVIDYWRIEAAEGAADCDDPDSPVWSELQMIVEEREYTADDGKVYRVSVTFVDSGYSQDTVAQFCSQYREGVYPIIGASTAAKGQGLREFAPFETRSGVPGFRLIVDRYKDRIAPVLRRDWTEGGDEQPRYHFNAPQDATDAQLKELTVEQRREKRDARGRIHYEWHRPGNPRNELWDLLVYGHAAIDVLAWSVCREKFGLATVDWPQFWGYAHGESLYYSEPAA
jgi:phage terminase large subunit GpA-like protein